MSRSLLQLPATRPSKASRYQGSAHPAPPRPSPLPTPHGRSCLYAASLVLPGWPLCRPSWEHCPPLPSPILWPGGGNGLGPPEGSASLWTGVRPLGAECRDPSLPRTARRLTSRVQPHAPGPPPGLPLRTPRHVPIDLGPDPPGEVGEVGRRQHCVCRPRTDETRWRWAPGGDAESVVRLSRSESGGTVCAGGD